MSAASGNRSLPSPQTSNSRSAMPSIVAAPIDPSSTKMTCMDHASGGEEIECAYCNKRKVLDEFSKNNRKSDDPKCKQCVAWIEIQDPEIIPGYLPGGHKSFEENRILAYGEIKPSQRAILAASAPVGVSPLQTLGLDTAALSSIYTASPATTGSRSSSVSISSAGNAASAGKTPTSLPPHLRARLGKRSIDSNSEVNSIIETEDAENGDSSAGWSNVTYKRQHKEVGGSEGVGQLHSANFSQADMNERQSRSGLSAHDDKKGRKKSVRVKAERLES